VAFAAKGAPVFGPRVSAHGPIQLVLQIHSGAVSFGFCGQSIRCGLPLWQHLWRTQSHHILTAPIRPQTQFSLCDPPCRSTATAPNTTVHDPGLLHPNPRAPRATANRAAPLQAGARSMGRGLRVGVVDSFGWGFVWGAQAMDSLCRGRANPLWNYVQG
jgi:hypothetical protein